MLVLHQAFLVDSQSHDPSTWSSPLTLNSCIQSSFSRPLKLTYRSMVLCGNTRSLCSNYFRSPTRSFSEQGRVAATCCSHMLQRRNAKKLNTKKWWQCATYHDTSALPKLSMLRLAIATRQKWSFTDNILASLAPRRSLLHIHLSSPTCERHCRHGV
jgi:hypothetical protein